MKSIFTIYVVWSAVLFVHGSWVVLSSDFSEKIGQEAFTDFLMIFYLGAALFIAIGALLAWFTQKRKLWAVWLFTAFCVYSGIDYILGIIARGRMEDIAVDATDWFKGIVIAGVWLCLAGYAWYLRPNQALKHDARKARAS